MAKEMRSNEFSVCVTGGIVREEAAAIADVYPCGVVR